VATTTTPTVFLLLSLWESSHEVFPKMTWWIYSVSIKRGYNILCKL